MKGARRQHRRAPANFGHPRHQASGIRVWAPRPTDTCQDIDMTRGYLDRPDCRIYYEVTGSGPMLLFAHGLGGNHLSWWQQVPYFRDRYTCVTFAHRGFAPSSAPPAGPDPD